ncbi:hypothetical protein GCM10010187_26900 [Actinomadura coerulea]|nr:hypothetical protein GCM10010187_26900 [Actinomadura coerulea]
MAPYAHHPEPISSRSDLAIFEEELDAILRPSGFLGAIPEQSWSAQPLGQLIEQSVKSIGVGSAIVSQGAQPRISTVVPSGYISAGCPRQKQAKA